MTKDAAHIGVVQYSVTFHTLTVVAGNALSTLKYYSRPRPLGVPRPRDALHFGVGPDLDAVRLQALSQRLDKGLKAAVEAVHRPFLFP